MCRLDRSTTEAAQSSLDAERTLVVTQLLTLDCRCERTGERSWWAVAAWQQHEFVWYPMQLGPKSLRFCATTGLQGGKRNAHLYGLRHHGSRHWSGRLFLASPSGCGHAACTAPQIKIATALQKRPAAKLFGLQEPNGMVG